MECLSQDRVLGYLASDATSIGLAEIEAHIDGCEPCRFTIAATIRAGRSSVPTPTEVGARIGRYVVHSLHGAGAMGHVLEARDPELDRRVAIKVVRHHGEGDDARALREARALARIAHPNVVTVHDVGTWDGGVFLAMEFVDGANVRDWLATPRAVRDVIRVFADVARGMAAAHAVGLIHRDIKPENLVVGNDGRVRILDFGLATADPVDGEKAGTPAYMAPELELGEATAASDQYSFGLTLYEALEGKRAMGPPTFVRTPRWARPAIARALASDPALRFRGMFALARALDAGLGRRRRIGIAAVVALALATGLATMALVMETGNDTCGSGPDEKLDDVHAALAARIGVPFADRATAKLSAWQSRAAALRGSTCKAARANEHGATERLRCIDAVERDVHVVVTALAHPNPTLATGALETIDRASDLSPCTALVLPAAQEPFLAAGFEVQLASLAVSDAGGDWESAERGALALAKHLDHDTTRSLEARAWLLVGRARMTARRVVPAREAFERALLAAEIAGDEPLRGAIYLALVGSNLEPRRRPEARRWLALARAVLTKVGDQSNVWRLGMLDGVLDDDPTRGAATLQAAADAYAKAVPGEDENTVILLGTLGSVLDAARQLDASVATLRRAVAIGERVLGPAHPALIQRLQDLAYTLAKQGKIAEAIAVARRALAIAEHSNGDVGVSTVRLALELMRTDGQTSTALELVDRAVPLVTAYDGPQSALAGNVLVLRGILRGQLGRDAEAIEDFLRALAIERSYLAPDAPDFIDLFEYLGRSQRAVGRTDDALRSFLEVKTIRARQPDYKPVDDVAVETAMGGTLVDADRIVEGVPHLERALELSRNAPDREAIAFAEVELAKALIAAKRDRARTRQLLGDARAIYLAQDSGERERLVGWFDEVKGLLHQVGGL